MLGGKLFSIISAIVLVSCAGVARSAWIDSPERGHRGWYGYEREIEPIEKVQKKHEEKVQKISERTETPFRWPSPEELYRMKPSEIKKYIERASEEAIANPTQENVSRWIRYVHVAQVKASEFAGAWAWVMQQSPDLYRQAALYPALPLGNRAYWRSVWNDIKKLLSEKQKDYAVILLVGLERFYDEAALKVIEKFLEYHPGWRIETVDVRKNPGLAERLGVTYTPQFYLLKRGEEKPFPLAAGPVSVSRLEKTIYHTILVLEGKKPPMHAPYYPFNRPMLIETKSSNNFMEGGKR